jgi:hypothetical protein
VVTGTQGWGVRTPDAAAVAAETCGFAIEEHIPKDMIFVIGTLSMMFANGCAEVTLFFGRTVRLLGVVPNEH